MPFATSPPTRRVPARSATPCTSGRVARAILARAARALHTGLIGARVALLLLGLWSLAACSSRSQPRPADAGAPDATPAAAKPAAENEAPALLDGLGAHHWAVTTDSPEAQRYFDQGLALSYGFNHDAAVRSFEAATRRDPACAMCFWGIALAHGPNINAPMGPEAGRAAYGAIQQALALVAANELPDLEEELVQALATRYAAEPPGERAALDQAYADAMRGVRARHPEHTDVATLTAEALMNLSPWNYWTAEGAPRENTEELVALLEGVLARQPDHLGANHYYIHAIEKFEPDKGVPSAERLADLAPAAGHLVHMPSHIFWRVGRYDDALEINQRASAADERFFATCRAGAFYRAAYYPHNLHFLWAAASAEGRSELALSSARKLAAETRDGMASFAFLEEFVSIPMVTLARFGRWDTILGEPRPDPERPYLTGIWHYVRGLAYVRTGRADQARRELDALRRVAAEPRTVELRLAGGTASAADLLAIGEAHLEGELAAEAGDEDAAVSALERAVARQDALLYMEPPPWYFPTRQALGAVLLDAGRAREAEAVYRADLVQYPNNGWSLYGLARSLEARGRAADAAWADQGFQNAWRRADVALAASRF